MLAPELAEVEGADVVAWGDGEGPPARSPACSTASAAARRRALPTASRSRSGGAARPRPRAGRRPAGRAARAQAPRRARAPARRRPPRRRGGGLDRLPSRSTGVTERELALRLTIRFLEAGAAPYDHYIVATGAHGALPHHVSGDTPIDPARPLLCDFGCTVAGYHSDITRVYLPEGADGEVREALEIVRAAHDAVIAGLEPGLPAHEADKLARDVIGAAGHGERFIHRTGHGVGLEIHEPPYLRPGNPEPLQAGHVFTVEPGIYVPGRFGVRFENLVHLGPDGPELLNAAARRAQFAS